MMQKLTIEVPDWLAAGDLDFLKGSVLNQLNAMVDKKYLVIEKTAKDAAEAERVIINSANSIVAKVEEIVEPEA